MKRLWRLLVGTLRGEKIIILDFKLETEPSKSEVNCKYDRAKYSMDEPRFYKEPKQERFVSLLTKEV